MTTPELLAELDTALADAVRRAANRAEHLRLIRIQGLVGELQTELGTSMTSQSSPTELAS